MTLVQKSGISFKGQKVYIGIDVHKKSYQVRGLINGEVLQKSVRLPSQAERIIKWSREHYPEAELVFGYEAGFSGLSLSRQLQAAGYCCHVLHPADIPTTHKDQMHKNDQRDSAKIARALANPGVDYNYQIDPSTERLRQSVRSVWRYNGDVRRLKQRVVQTCYYLGLNLPQTASGAKSWSKASRGQLRRQAQQDQHHGLILWLDQLEVALDGSKKQWQLIDEMLQQSHLQAIYKALQTTPGIGAQLAAVISTEIGKIQRFSSNDHLRSYAGLKPREHSSGEQQNIGRISPRSNRFLRWAIIQAAWRIIEKDPEMGLRFVKWKKQCGHPNKAIIKIASLLLGRIAAMWRRGQHYRPKLNLNRTEPTKSEAQPN